MPRSNGGSVAGAGCGVHRLGQPVLNAAGEVVGQLSGACGTNVNDTCDSVSNATVAPPQYTRW